MIEPPGLVYEHERVFCDSPDCGVEIRSFEEHYSLGDKDLCWSCWMREVREREQAKAEALCEGRDEC